jgi:hypothetical protein
MFKRLIAWCTDGAYALRRRLTGAIDGPLPNGARVRLKIFDDRSHAARAAKQERLFAVAKSAEKLKWGFLKCPCGCGDQIALNLMASHRPRWTVEITSPSSFSVHPSVHAMSCGAHFWLEDGKIRWC